MLPINSNNKVAETHLLMNESSVKTYTKDNQVNYFNHITKSLTNSRLITKLPKGVIGFIAGASIGAITIELIQLISFSLINKQEKNLALTNTVLNDSMIFVKIFYTIVCAMLGYFIERDNYHKNNLYKI